ncbi:MAG: hypothetical protein QQN53_08280, partial [Nitrosopumilus sp.]
SWSRYRPKIIEYCLYHDLIKTEVRDGITIETIRLCMRYNKKTKEWYGKANSLMINIKEEDSAREMTEEELEKYHIMWVPEDDFSY